MAARLADVEERIERACERSGRSRDSVHLIGVTKGQPVECLTAARDAGLKDIGENRVQEAAEKHAAAPAGVSWHLIGPLQSNKARKALSLFDFFHSVDRPKIARILDGEAARAERRLPCFIQVNVGEDAAKHGFSPTGLATAIEPLADFEHLEFVGLMTMPPLTPAAQDARPYFRRLRQLRDELSASGTWRGWQGSLSMGMTRDFEIAIEEGATHVRVGTAIFGPRSTK